MIVKLIKSLAYTVIILLTFFVVFNNFDITDLKMLVVFAFFISIFEKFLLPLLKTILYPLNFLFFGQVRRVLVVICFVLFIHFIPFANISDFYFEGGNLLGIMIPEVSLSRSIFIVVIAVLYDLIKIIVFKRKEVIK